MLNVKTPEGALELINSKLTSKEFTSESIKTTDAIGRVLLHDVISEENVPGFNRSTVDGYAVLASDTFGCSESIPAVLEYKGEVLMGESAEQELLPGTCIGVSTGGELPNGANAAVMVEHIEDYGSNMVGILKPVAPGNNVIFKGDDVSIGEKILTAGTELTIHDIGILSALGYSQVDVRRKPVVGIISSGDELTDASEVPKSGQIRNVNTPLLVAAVNRFGAKAVDFGIVRDKEKEISQTVRTAVATCDIVLISGGSSAGLRDLTAKVIGSEGELLLHGIAMKPGKPTILGVVKGKPVFGLPGHPVAAYFVTELFVRPLITQLMGAIVKRLTTKAVLGEAVSSNHGRAEYIAVRLDNRGNANPVRGKSGLIASLAGVDGYICVPRDCEGLAEGAEVIVTYF